MAMTLDVVPGAIPPRTSSTHALTNGGGGGSAGGAVGGASLHSANEQSLGMLSEDEWIASSKTKSPKSPQSPLSPKVKPKAAAAISSPAMTPPLEPPQPPQPQAGDKDPIPQLAACWSDEKEKILLGPYDYMIGHPGKDIRAHLIAAFNVWLKVPEASLSIITKAVGMLHTASLLVDDVEDSSVLRRGVPVAHNIFGTAQTINSANYIYFAALQELLKLNNATAVQIYTEELLNLHRGQGMDLFWRDSLTCPSEDDYLEMVGNKTGGLFRLAIKLMQAESLSDMDCVPLVNTIGLLYQILDDYKNLSDTSYTANKGLCEDLTEGKFSFPVIHSIRSDPSCLVLTNILRQKTKDDEVKRYAVAYMEKTGSFSYTRKVLRSLVRKALALVDELDAGQAKGDAIRFIIEKMRAPVEKVHHRASSTATT